MAILAECPNPTCKKKQSIKRGEWACSCGEDLAKAKRSERIRYWVDYLMANGKARREFVGYSIEEAKALNGEHTSKGKENRKPQGKMTFSELANWYLGLEKVKAKAYYPTLKVNLKSFNNVFGEMIVPKIKTVHLEDYQEKRHNQVYSDSYIDQEIGAARTMVYKAFDEDLVGGEVRKTFMKVKDRLKPGANARKRVLSLDEYGLLVPELPKHTSPMVQMGFWTGMRWGEIYPLRWDQVDLGARMIRLSAGDTKERMSKRVPISKTLLAVLAALPSRLRSEYVFLYRGKPIGRDIRNALEPACKRAGIPYGRNRENGFTFHDLRHTFATMARKAKAPKNVTMEIMGHSTGNDMNRRYDTVDEEDLIETIDQIEGYVSASLDLRLDPKPSEDKKEASQNQLTP